MGGRLLRRGPPSLCSLARASVFEILELGPAER